MAILTDTLDCFGGKCSGLFSFAHRIGASGRWAVLVSQGSFRTIVRSAASLSEVLGRKALCLLEDRHCCPLLPL